MFTVLPSPYTLHGLFDTSFTKCKNKVAVEYYEKNESVQKLSYQDVEDRSNKIHLCLKEINVNKTNAGISYQNGKHNSQKCVGIYMATNINIPSIIIGVLNSGCKFTPLNPKSPQSILNDLICNIGINIFITTKKIISLGKLDTFKCPQLKMIEPYDCPTTNNEDALVICYKDENTYITMKTEISRQFAYSISTSGTTGKPKIVNVPHQCIVANILHLRSVFKIKSHDKIPMMAPLTFDPSIVEIFLALSSSACLVMISEEVKLDPDYLAHVLFSISNITILQCTPTVINRFSVTDLHSKVFSPVSSLKILALGGEACPSYKLQNYWLKESMKVIEIYNIYGITEVSSWAMLHRLSWNNIKEGSTESIPLGIPLYLTSLEIRDTLTESVLCRIESCLTISQFDATPNLNKIVVRIIDEIDISECYTCEGFLFIGGKYRVCTDSDSTANNSCAPEEGVYRNSGDIVKVTLRNINKIMPTIDLKKSFILGQDEICINYVGRSDKQIKRHGKRINLLYLKQHLENLEIIFSAHVLFCNGKESREKYLVAFVCFKQNTRNENKRLISSSCFNELGHLYVPDSILILKELPITLHGKVDESALTNYFLEYESENSSNNIEEHFFKCLLECIPTLNQDSSLCKSGNLLKYTFIELGGNSFALVQFSSMLKQEFSNLLDIADSLLHLKLGDVLSHINNFSGKGYFKNTSLESRLSTQHKQQIAQISMNENIRPIKKLKSSFNEYFYVGRTGQNSLNYTKVHQLALIKKRQNKDNLVEDLKLSLKIQWMFNTHKCVDASPLVVVSMNDERNSTVLIGSHSHILACISIVTGSVKWKTKLGDRIESCACLTYCGQYICVGCYDRHIYSLDVDTGKILWKFKTNREVKCSPVAGRSGSIIFVGSHDGLLYCLDLHNKEMVWKLDCGGGSIFSSPAIEFLDDILTVIYACTLSGKILSINCKSGQERWTINVGNPIFSSPLITEVGLCVGCVDHNMYMFSKTNGNTIWKFSTGQPIFSSPAFFGAGHHNLIVFGSHDTKMYCVNATSGQLIWKNENLSEKSPIYASAFPFQINIFNRNEVVPFDLVAVASIDGKLVIANIKNGEVLASLKLPSEVFSSPVCVTLHSSAEEKELYILVGCRDDFLYCVNLVI